MSFAEQWAKNFSKEYNRQKIDDWWSNLRKESDKAWTYRIAELLRSLAQKMGYQMEYEITADFSWYQKGSTSPSVAIEHENVYSKDDILNHEVRTLLESIGSLKVLITYVGKRAEEKELINEFQKIHKRRLHEPVAKQIKEEFLFLTNDYYVNYAKWRCHIFYPTGKVKQITLGNRRGPLSRL